MNIDYSLLTIEMLTAGLALGLLVLSLVVPGDQRKGFGYLTAAGLAIIFAISFAFNGVNKEIIGGMYLIDDFGNFFKQLALVAGVLVALASIPYVEKLESYRGEYYSLLVFATLGMVVMVGAGDLISLYLGLELMTITFFVLTAFKRGDSKSAEAGIKYVLLGAMSSAILLYGLSMLYGVAKTTVISELVSTIQAGQISPALILGLMFLVGGFGFKISAVPFHMWSPDVYEGAPTPVTSYLAVGSKAAAFAAFVRIFMGGMPQIQEIWIALFAGLSALSMIIGNLIAIPQTNIKRMLAFSGVAQAGYILTGMVAGTNAGIKGLAFYLMIYVFATIGAFTVAIGFSNATGSDEIKDMAGLSQRNPLMAAVMLVCLLSMAGIPPLAGFAGKLFLFSAIVAQGKLWLALVGLIMSMVSVYYYLSVAKSMYMGEAADPSPIEIPGSLKLVLIVSMVVTIFLGIYPAPLTGLAEAAASVFALK
ncbi:MAG: NADH-quinone oxidoreductase subunit N [Clostridia bacterium]|nr:NADH-quinone oxidoreductase subunit N [Clostridia bacterium]